MARKWHWIILRLRSPNPTRLLGGVECLQMFKFAFVVVAVVFVVG